MLVEITKSCNFATSYRTMIELTRGEIIEVSEDLHNAIIKANVGISKKPFEDLKLQQPIGDLLEQISKEEPKNSKPKNK